MLRAKLGLKLVSYGISAWPGRLGIVTCRNIPPHALTDRADATAKKKKLLMTQHRLREFSNVTIDNRSMTNRSKKFTVLYSRNIITDYICSHCRLERMALAKQIYVAVNPPNGCNVIGCH